MGLVSVASRHIYDPEIGRGIHVTTLDSSVAVDDPQSALASIFGVPKRSVMSTDKLSGLLQVLKEHPHWFIGRAYRSPLGHEMAWELSHSLRDRGELGLADYVSALLWQGRPWSPLLGLAQWGERYPMPIEVSDIGIPELDIPIALAALSASATPPPESIRNAASEVLRYHAPFGLSPETQSRPLAELLQHANYAAVIPVVHGLEEIGPAVRQHEWLLAIQASAVTAASVVVLLSGVAVAQWVVRWIGRRTE